MNKSKFEELFMILLFFGVGISLLIAIFTNLNYLGWFCLAILFIISYFKNDIGKFFIDKAEVTEGETNE